MCVREKNSYLSISQASASCMEGVGVVRVSERGLGTRDDDISDPSPSIGTVDLIQVKKAIFSLKIKNKKLRYVKKRVKRQRIIQNKDIIVKKAKQIL